MAAGRALAQAPGYPNPPASLGTGRVATPCRTRGVPKAPRLSPPCRAAATQVAGLRRAADGCELPAKRAMLTGELPQRATRHRCWHRHPSAARLCHCTSSTGRSHRPAPPLSSICGSLRPRGAMRTAVLHAQLSAGAAAPCVCGALHPKWLQPGSSVPPAVPALQRPSEDGAMRGALGAGCPLRKDVCGEQRAVTLPPPHSAGCVPNSSQPGATAPALRIDSRRGDVCGGGSGG